MRFVVIAAAWTMTIMAGSVPAAAQGIPGVIYAEQPTGVELSTYITTWPALEPELQRLRSAQRPAADSAFLLSISSTNWRKRARVSNSTRARPISGGIQTSGIASW